MEEGTNGEGVTFHRVFVQDQELREYIRNKLQRKDRVLLNGRIGHMTDTGKDGKKIYSGFINVTDIYRIARRTSTQVEANESEKLHEELSDSK